MDSGKTQVRLCTFSGSQNLPCYVAVREGFFAARGLEVTLHYTAGSAPQIAGLVRGQYDLIQTAPDNVVNANSNPSAFGIDPAAAPRLRMLMGGSTGPLWLCALPGITGWTDLRGTAVGVDNPTSGFALVLHDMLARHGLREGTDYTVVVAGGTSQRLEALQTGSVAATLLYPPYSTMAHQAGMRLLASSTTYYDNYASLATAGLASWIEDHSLEVTHTIEAVRQALAWIYDASRADLVQDILRSEVSISALVAAQAYAAFVDPLAGFGEEPAIDMAGLRQVIALRAAAGTPLGRFAAPEEHLDLRWYEAALH